MNRQGAFTQSVLNTLLARAGAAATPVAGRRLTEGSCAVEEAGQKEPRNFLPETLGTVCPPPQVAVGTAPLVLFAPAGTARQAAPVLNTVLSLRRFACQVALCAEPAWAETLHRHLRANLRFYSKENLEPSLFSHVLAVVAMKTPALLAELSAGLWQGAASAGVFGALWQDKSVLLVESDFSPAACQNQKLQEQHALHAQKAAELGCSFCPREDLLAKLLALLPEKNGREACEAPTGWHQHPKASQQTEPSKVWPKRVFVTRRDILACPAGGVFPLPQNAVVTDAALEEAQRLGVQLQKAKQNEVIF